MTPLEAAKRFGLLDREITKATANAIRRGQTYWRSLAINHFMTRGVGRAIWGSRGKSAIKDVKLIVKRRRVQLDPSGSHFTGGLTLKGLAAIQEKGGTTKAHIIRPKNAERLAFVPKGGGFVLTKLVKHPGSKIPAVPSVAPTLSQAAARMLLEVDKGLAKAVADAGLK